MDKEFSKIVKRIEKEDFEQSNEVIARTVTEFYIRMIRINKHKMNGEEAIAFWKNAQYALEEIIEMGIKDGYIVLDELSWYPTPEDCISALAKEEVANEE